MLVVTAVIDVVLVLVTVVNSTTWPPLPINLAVVPAVKPEPVIVNDLVASLSFAFVGDTLDTVWPECFILLLNIFFKEVEEVSYIIV